MEKKISVIIPVYNVQPYLRRCLDSVLGSTYQNIDVICVNDGSTDDSGLVLREYEGKDHRVTVITQDNQGLPAARNTGLARADGAYIAFIDADDWIHPEYFETLLMCAEKTGADIAVCDHIKVSADIEDQNYDASEIHFQTLDLSECIRNRNVRIYAWGKIYRREIIKGHWFAKGLKFSEDEAFNTDVLCETEAAVVYMERVLYYYFQRPESIVHQMTSYAVIIDKAEYLLGRVRLVKERARSVFLQEIIKDILSYRYAKRFDDDYKAAKERADTLFSRAFEYHRKFNIFNTGEYLIYASLARFACLYRAFRLINDPTLLKWERRERTRRRSQRR